MKQTINFLILKAYDPNKIEKLASKKIEHLIVCWWWVVPTSIMASSNRKERNCKQVKRYLREDWGILKSWDINFWDRNVSLTSSCVMASIWIVVLAVVGLMEKLWSNFDLLLGISFSWVGLRPSTKLLSHDGTKTIYHLNTLPWRFSTQGVGRTFGLGATAQVSLRTINIEFKVAVQLN